MCGGDDSEGEILLCDECNLPLHAYCVGFTCPVEGDWLCGECLEHQPTDPESHESDQDEEVASAA